MSSPFTNISYSDPLPLLWKYRVLLEIISWPYSCASQCHGWVTIVNVAFPGHISVLLGAIVGL